MNYPKYAEPREFKVVTICGSMRYYDRMIKVAEYYTAAGSVVLMPFVAVDPAAQEGEHKAMLDRMHRQKIDMADAIVVVVDAEAQYYGESTHGEIEYAERTHKQVLWSVEGPVAA